MWKEEISCGHSPIHKTKIVNKKKNYRHVRNNKSGINSLIFIISILFPENSVLRAA